jgi:hypothetical protein
MGQLLICNGAVVERRCPLRLATKAHLALETESSHPPILLSCRRRHPDYVSRSPVCVSYRASSVAVGCAPVLKS